MKGFTYTLSALIRKGLRTDRSNSRNSEGLIECFNLKPHIEGLIGYEELICPISGFEILWPYPQIVITSKLRFVLTATSIYEANSAWDTSLAITTTAGDLWDVVDYGDYVLFCNGAVLVTRSASGVYTASPYTSTIPLSLTMCNFKGQLVCGNIKSSWYDCGSDFVAWGQIGSADMIPDGSNTAGYRPMPWHGEVKLVKRLGEGVIVYCENGVGLLSPYAQTFGFKEMLGVGIVSKGCVGGNENEHLFVDSRNYLWSVNTNFEFKRLGYQEFMESMKADSIIVSFNSSLKEFHISDGIHSYIFTPYGLCKVYQRPTSVIVDGLYTFGVFDETLFEDSDLEGRITTDVLDFGSRGMKGMKTLENIEFGMEIDEYATAYGAVDYCYNSTGLYDRSSWITLNPEGQCAPLVTAPELRIAFKCSDFLEMKLDTLSVGIKYSDKRFRRGDYVTEIATRANI